MTKHFVTFFSPGTFVAEYTTKEIDSWDVEKAKEMALEITERYGATPYGFQFSTSESTDWAPKETARSGTYFLHADILTIEDVKALTDRDYSILISNMECNGYDRVAMNKVGYRWTLPFKDGDVAL